MGEKQVYWMAFCATKWRNLPGATATCDGNIIHAAQELDSAKQDLGAETSPDPEGHIPPGTPDAGVMLPDRLRSLVTSWLSLINHG